VALLAVSSCASTGSFAPIDAALERNDFAKSIALLEQKRSSLYTSRDSILYHLDRGMLSHYAELHRESASLLQEAERGIEEAFTRSITQLIATLLINDNAQEYGGEDYEDIYINAFNSLNFYHEGDLNGAMVEIRRMVAKLQHLSFRYDTAISNLQRHALDQNLTNLPQNPYAPTEFNNSALGRYLGMLFFRGAGLGDDARISRDWLLAAFANAPAVYRHPVPESISGELAIPGGMARLNVLAFGGLSPVKEENVVRIPLPGARWIRIALPEMVSRPSEISGVELVLDSGERFQLELLEDIDAVAKETFKARQQLIYLRTIIRATLKGAASSALTIASRERGGHPLLELASIGTQFFAELSERADVRMARFFPGKAYIAGVNLPPGRYSFKVRYYNKAGREIASVSFKDVIVEENRLNLVQAVSLR
jgi:hypothetical protein